MEDVRNDWFMQQHFTKDQLQELYDWEQKSGRVANVSKTNDGYELFHIEDINKSIDLCFMKEEYMLRRWADRLGYAISDGKTYKQFEEENGIKDEKPIVGQEVWKKDRTSLTMYGEKRAMIVSGDYALVAKRTASNAYEILFLNSEEYAEHLKSQK